MASVSQTFTATADSFTANTSDDYDLAFLAGSDILTIVRAGSLTADMGDDNDTVEVRGAGAVLRIDGGAGNDKFNGRGFAVTGTISGGAGKDTFTGFHAATGSTVILAGGAGDDTYRFRRANPATIVEKAGEGLDTVLLAPGLAFAMPANVEVLRVEPIAAVSDKPARITGNASNNQITGSAHDEAIFGGGGNDVIAGGGGKDTLWGGSGNDVLRSGGGTTTMKGEAGNDTFFGGSGTDTMIGGTGNDTYVISPNSAAAARTIIVEDAKGGEDTVVNYNGDVRLPENVENGLAQGNGSVSLFGNALGNVLTVAGAGSNNYVEGGAGNDTILFTRNAGTIYGGTGADRFVVFEGGFTFVYKSVADSTPRARDEILNFLPKSDVIDLTGIDIDATTAGRQGFHAVDAPQGHAGDLWLVHETANGAGSTWIRGDANGDKVADFELLVPETIGWDSITL